MPRAELPGDKEGFVPLLLDALSCLIAAVLARQAVLHLQSEAQSYLPLPRCSPGPGFSLSAEREEFLLWLQAGIPKPLFTVLPPGAIAHVITVTRAETSVYPLQGNQSSPTTDTALTPPALVMVLSNLLSSCLIMSLYCNCFACSFLTPGL